MKVVQRLRPLSVFLMTAALSIVCCGSAAWAQNADSTTILAQAKQAAGGDAWDRIRTIHLHEQTLSGGLIGAQDECDDVKTGRFLVRSQRAGVMEATGFDGVSVWTQAPGGYSYVLGDEDARQGAVNQAYQAARAFWFSDRANATTASAGTQQENGHIYDVIQVTPQAGRPFTIWVDQATHLIDRYVEQQGEDVQIVRFLDYRDVPGGVKLPFTIRTGDGDTQYDEVDTVQTAEINAPLSSHLFAVPPIPAPDFRFLNGKSSTTIPFRLDDGKLLVPIRLNGQGPFEAELDSGGNNIVQPAVAKRIRLTAHGTSQEGGGGEGFVTAGRTTVNTVDLGGLRLTNQAYKILSFSDSAPERTLIGLQILQRFVVSIDFDKKTVTLTRPDQFVYHGTGRVVPFHFQDNQPEVNGAVDGIAGVFTIDTGDDASLLLIAPFAKRYDLKERYQATIPYGGHAVGGATHGVMTRADTFSLFGADGRSVLSVHRPLTRISLQTGGFDADRYVSGNVGIGILQQFNLIFDYSRQHLIFEKNANYGKKDVYNQTGLLLQRNGLAWDVTYVVPSSPAADAGIKTGDMVVAINGKDAAHLTADQRYDLFLQSVGTKVTLTVRSVSTTRTIALRLRDVL